MTISVSHDAPRHPRLRAWLDKDGNRVGIWITEPRVTLAYAVSEVGQAILRLAGKIHDEVIGDVGEVMDEALDAGYEAGYRAGSQSSYEAMKLCYRAGRDESTGEGR